MTTMSGCDQTASTSLPYRIAVLCYLFDAKGRILLLRRKRAPNRDLLSPVGGKLERSVGESPTGCAIREIHEEVGVQVSPSDLHLTGIVSETGFEDRMHWLMFLFELLTPVQINQATINEGTLEWHERAALDQLPLPETDRQVIWPLFWRYRKKFFAAHIDCRGGIIEWRIEQPAADS